MSDQVPQHDPPPDAKLVQPEVDERHDSIVLEGDDVDHVFPPTELDPYRPEPGARPGETRQLTAVYIAVAALFLLFAIVFLVALLR
jgi:hypothetical protein